MRPDDSRRAHLSSDARIAQPSGQEVTMVDMLQPRSVEPTAVFERADGEVEIHEHHPRETAVIHVDVPVDLLPAAVGEALGELGRRMAEAGVELAGPPFTRYLSFGPERILAEIGVPVLRPAPHSGRVFPGRLQGGRVASVIHVGPYEALADAYVRLQRWLDDHGLHGTGPMWEVYWSDPQAEPDSASWRTEILVPLD
jgi:effector-binding domain-containing protein